MAELQKFCSWLDWDIENEGFSLSIFLQTLLYYFYIFILCIINNFVSSVCYWKSEYEGKVIYSDASHLFAKAGGRRKSAMRLFPRLQHKSPYRDADHCRWQIALLPRVDVSRLWEIAVWHAALKHLSNDAFPYICVALYTGLPCA